MATDVALEATGIVKTFSEGFVSVAVLHGIDLQLQRGEVVALEGPSGSGKTTLLSILGCILSPSSGWVAVNGRVVNSSRPRVLPEIRKRSIGLVFQQFNLFPALTALENVEYSLNVRGHRGKEARQEAERVLAEVGLADRSDFLPRDLSGGQKQRVAIARALAGRPPILLADEPTANLDSATGLQILRLFRRLAKESGSGLLIVTHDPKVSAFADRRLRIEDGKLVESSSLQACFPQDSVSHNNQENERKEYPYIMKLRLILFSALGVSALAATFHEIRVASDGKALFAKSDAAAASPLVPTTKLVRAEGRVVTYPGASVTVGTEVQGTIISLPVKEKDFLRKGEPVAILRSDDDRAALSSASARVAQDEAEVRFYQGEAKRQRSLWQQGIGTRQAFDRAQRDLESAQARRNMDTKEVQRMKAVVAKTVIFAPISGVVTSRIVEPGETVKEGAALISLADLRRMRIEAEIDEFDAGRVKLGQEVEITAEGFDGQRWRGRVEEIPDAVEPRQIKPQDPAAPTDTRVLLLKIALLERTPLKLNQRVQVAVKTGG